MANVWDWDPEWTVMLYVDGARRGLLASPVGLDRWAVERFDGPDIPEHRPWVQPVPSEHLFYAPLAESETNVVVEATDRSGRVFPARLNE